MEGGGILVFSKLYTSTLSLKFRYLEEGGGNLQIGHIKENGKQNIFIII